MSLSFVHQFVPGKDPSAPPVLLLHGTGGTEHDLLPVGNAMSPGSSLLSPRGKVSENGAARYFARIAEGIFDPTEIAQRTQDLADFISEAAQVYGFDPGRLIAIGYSNGANIAATLLQLRPIVLSAAALLRPMVVIDRPAAPHSLDGKRVLIVSGTFDELVPYDHPHRLSAHLRAGGAEVDLQDNVAGHTLAPSDMKTIDDWFIAGRTPVRR